MERNPNVAAMPWCESRLSDALSGKFRDLPIPGVFPAGADSLQENGLCTCPPGNKWILNDTYPDEDRLQHPYLYVVARDRRIPLGRLLYPPEDTGEWHRDTHPRLSPDEQEGRDRFPRGGTGR